ncbi:MAG TPA: sugar phosphate nucleotidyltransferase [Bacteroidia bacterium]|jgi:NDP-sugar pyrophosphorylase family protein|nr:sugar phosphate nucleotidyltransferase [Bacteroidia bacterium]
MKAVILAGGLGSRLKPFTEIIPKPLLPIGEKAVLEIQIERFKKHGFDEIYLATNYKSEYVENFIGDGSRYGIKLMLSREEKPLGTAGPLTLLKDKLTEPFVVMNGDILSLIDFTKLYDFALQQKNALTITIKKIVTPYAFGNIFFKGDLVTNIEEKPDIITYALAGIYVMTPEIFNYIPEDTFYGMDLLIRGMLAKNKPISKYEIEEYWLDIGRIEDYTKAQEVYKTHFKES